MLVSRACVHCVVLSLALSFPRARCPGISLRTLLSLSLSLSPHTHLTRCQRVCFPLSLSFLSVLSLVRSFSRCALPRYLSTHSSLSPSLSPPLSLISLSFCLFLSLSFSFSLSLSHSLFLSRSLCLARVLFLFLSCALSLFLSISLSLAHAPFFFTFPPLRTIFLSLSLSLSTTHTLASTLALSYIHHARTHSLTSVHTPLPRT